MRAASRMAGCSINTVTKLLVDAGIACQEFHDRTVRGVIAERIECDEIWAFAYAKQANVQFSLAAPDDAGDLWTYTAIDPDSKLLVSWHVGSRDLWDTMTFMADLHGRLATRVQLTTDGWKTYPEAVLANFRDQVDYGQVVKAFETRRRDESFERRYSPPGISDISRVPITGDPDEEKISTSIVERHNLTIHMSLKRYTRLSNAFTKKVENHIHMFAIYSVFYNFCRPHISLGALRTPAMEANLAPYVFDPEFIIRLVEEKRVGSGRLTGRSN